MEIPEETLRDVMWEIAEARERQQEVSVEALKPWLNTWIEKLESEYGPNDESRAYRIVLQLIDDLQRRA